MFLFQTNTIDYSSRMKKQKTKCYHLTITALCNTIFCLKMYIRIKVLLLYLLFWSFISLGAISILWFYVKACVPIWFGSFLCVLCFLFFLSIVVQSLFSVSVCFISRICTVVRFLAAKHLQKFDDSLEHHLQFMVLRKYPTLVL